MTTTNAAEARPAPATPDLTLCELGPSPIAGVESHAPFCLKVHRALKLAGLRYTSRHAENPAAHRLNPTGQVPILLVGARAVTDSTAIVHEIDRLRPGVLDRGLDARGQAEACAGARVTSRMPFRWRFSPAGKTRTLPASSRASTTDTS